MEAEVGVNLPSASDFVLELRNLVLHTQEECTIQASLERHVCPGGFVLRADSHYLRGRNCVNYPIGTFVCCAVTASQTMNSCAEVGNPFAHAHPGSCVMIAKKLISQPE